jgi:zinc/manganese transport system substrate-binding protein
VGRGKRWLALVAGVATLAGVAACGNSGGSDASAGTKRVVVTYSILGSVVKEVVGDNADVTVLIPNGADPHEWEPSAKDIERLNHADLVIRNGVGLEGGLLHALDEAQHNGVKTFVASDHITVRHVGQGEGVPSGDPDQALGAQDPHLWMDPLTVEQVVMALGPVLAAQGIDVSAGVTTVTHQLEALNTSITGILAAVPDANRKLVTGHESLGYFAARYHFTLVGAIIPSLTSQAEVSAADLSKLTKLIKDESVGAIFTELGTPPKVAQAIGSETGVKVVELASHNLPTNGDYATFLTDDATKIAAALRGS